ncbi:uncharacterized protein [Epargyreus clarus]|uniref:uncharacterized protein n=1 Tax=Epargyreus clarus TaxID=520877 RepID=UPI003C2C9821
MSDEEQVGEPSSSQQLLTAEFKDGKLEIVEVAHYSKDGKQLEISDESSNGNEEHKYMQVLDTESGKNMVVDLLNFTLVRGEDGEESFRLVSNSDVDCGESDATVTCVLSNEDGDEQETQEYVMVEGDQGEPLVFLPSTTQERQVVELPPKRVEPKKQITPIEILERTKALQKARALLAAQSKIRVQSRAKSPQHSKRRKGELPPTHELLASPSFKLFLYCCKLCRFKCNAVKELTEHKLMKHVQDNHIEAVTISAKVYLDSAEVEAADVLVCGACGFESGSRDSFKQHIEEEHGATAC